MRLSTKEKAGIVDTSRTNEGVHKGESFLKNLADDEKRRNMDPEVVEDGERHIRDCEKCRRKFEYFKQDPKERGLPL